VEVADPRLIVQIAECTFSNQFTVGKTSFVLAAIRPGVRALPLVLIVDELTIVNGTARKYNMSLTVHFVVFPLSSVDNSLGSLVCSVTVTFHVTILVGLVFSLVTVVVWENEIA